MKTTFATLGALGFATATWILLPSPLHAATRVKANNADALNLTSSWTNGIVPVGADVAQFDATVTGPLVLSLGADTAWNQINFVNPGGEITLNSGATLTLSNNTPIIFGAGAADLTLNCDVNFAGAAFSSIRSPAGQTLTLGGVIDGRDVTVTLGNSAGTILLGSPNTVRIGSVVQVNTAGMRLGLGASSVGEPVTSGPLGTNLFTWASSSINSELFTYNGDQTLANPVRIQFSPLTFNSADDLTFTGVADFNNGNRTLNITSNGVLRFTGIISNATGLTKIGSGVLELGGTNMGVWNNGLSIFGGTVRLLTNNVIPDGGSAGTIRMTNTTEVLDLNGFSDTIRGLASPVGAGIWGGTLDNTAPNTTSVLTMGDLFTYTLAGMVQNSGPNSKLALVKIGTGGLFLTNANTFSGGITNSSASQIFLNTIGAAGTGPIVLATDNAELTYSGGGAMTWTNAIILESGGRGIISANDGNTLEIASVISGAGGLLLPNTLFKQGQLTFSGDNTFTGGLGLAGGTLTLNHPRAAGRGALSIGDPLVYNGSSIAIVAGVELSGVNALTNAVIMNRFFTFGGTNALELSGPVTLAFSTPQVSINVNNPAGVVISGPIGGTGFGFNKTGDRLTLTGVATFDGRMSISTGTLAIGPGGSVASAAEILLGGTGMFDVSAVTGFTIAPTQILSGYGGVIGNVTVNGTLKPAGVIFTLGFTNNLTLTASSTTTMTINRNASPAPEQVVCDGTLTFGGALVVTHVGGTLQAGDTFDLFGFSGNPGSFATLTLPTLDSGLAWDTSNLSLDGTIRVISTSVAQPQLTNPQLVNPSNFVMTASGGATNGTFRVLTQTNVVEPMVNWFTLSTNLFDGDGNLTITNLVNPAEPQRFFRIVEP